MKLSQSTIQYIDKVTAVAQIAGIDAIVFRKDLVSGKDDIPAVLLIQKDNLPDFEFDELAIIRVPLFRQRLNVIRDSGVDFSVDYDPQKGLVNLQAGRTKAEYRAGNATAIRPTKGINDQLGYTFTISNDLVSLISKAASGFPSKDPIIVFTSSGKEVEITITDDEAGDSFSSIIATDLEANGSLSVRYSLKTLLPLLKQHETDKLKIGERGTLELVVQGITLVIIPRM